MSRVYIYVIGAAALHVPDPPFKIGVSTNVADRLARLQTGSPVRLQVYHKRLVPSGPDERSAVDRERNLHWHFRAHQVHGEWFNVPLDEVVWAVNCASSGTLAQRPEGPLRRRPGGSREQRRAKAAYDEWLQHRRDIGG